MIARGPHAARGLATPALREVRVNALLEQYIYLSSLHKQACLNKFSLLIM